jgi:CxxC motif-containing protein
MVKKLTCIECPKGCALSIDIENCRVVKVTGNQCPKGEEYAAAEIENPMRILTSAVLAEGLSVKMVPVRTDGPIPKTRLMEAMREVKKMKLDKPFASGGVIAENFLGLGVRLITTRDVSAT